MANILVVDDESALLNLLSRTLRQNGYTVIATSDPLAAIHSVSEGEPPIDLLVTDVDMRPISGFELVRRLKQSGFNAPVLFMSGYPDLACAIDGAAGEHAVLDKPFTIHQLLTVVGKILARGSEMCESASGGDFG